ncbi:MAG TPA: DUF1833 family protein [Nitrospira sp.]|nr:DUF1833 family protein [Nitrospira sp.]
MRTLSTLMLQVAHAQETGEVVLARTEISHPLILDGPLRFVNNLTDVVASGQTFTAFPFQVTLPDDADEGVPKLRLVLDNVDRRIVQTIRSLPPSPAPTVRVDLFLASQPTVLEASFTDLVLRQTSYDVLTVSGDLLVDEDDLEPYPQYTMTPAAFPGLF